MRRITFLLLLEVVFGVCMAAAAARVPGDTHRAKVHAPGVYFFTDAACRQTAPVSGTTDGFVPAPNSKMAQPDGVAVKGFEGWNCATLSCNSYDSSGTAQWVTTPPPLYSPDAPVSDGTIYGTLGRANDSTGACTSNSLVWGWQGSQDLHCQELNGLFVALDCFGLIGEYPPMPTPGLSAYRLLAQDKGVAV